MKALTLLGILFGVVVLGGCTSKTEYGQCVGIGEDRRPDLEYKISANNLVWAILGFELIAPPVVVAVDETFCPVGKKVNE